MNWKEIEKKYPKGYKLEEEWIKEHLRDDYGPGFNINRDLYDFFDEQEIYIEIWMKNDEEKLWGYTWHLAKMAPFEDDGLFVSRKEAEEASFLKAFEILENK